MAPTTIMSALVLMVVAVVTLPMTAEAAVSFGGMTNSHGCRKVWGVSSSWSFQGSSRAVPSWKAAAALLPPPHLIRGGANSDAAEEEGDEDEESSDNAEKISVESTTIQGGWGDDDQEQAKMKDVVDRIADEAEKNESSIGVEEEEEEEEEAASIEVQPFMEEEAAAADAEAEQEDDSDDSQSSFATAVMDDPSIDDDSSAFVDRMELADAYDEGETTPGSFEEENASRAAPEGGDSVEADADAGDTTSSSTDDTPASEEATATTKGDDNENKVPEIDEATRDILIKELKYTRREVNAMKYEIAAMVAEKRLFRPNQGMPANWYKTGLQSSKLGGNMKTILKRVVLPVAATALAAFGATTVMSGGDDSSSSFDPLASVVAETAVPMETLVEEETDDIMEPSTAQDAAIDETPAAATETPAVKPVNEHVDALGEPHPHSVKPGQVPNDELDVTWLDKAITAVENKIKAFLRMEL